MTTFLAMSLSDFSALGDSTWLTSILYGVILVAAAIVGALAVGFAARGVMALMGRDLSGAGHTRMRLLGAVLGAALAYWFVDVGGGRGPGPGGPGTGGGTGPVGGAPPQAASDAKVRLLLLGPDTKPPYPGKNRFFAIIDSKNQPQEPIDRQSVMAHLTGLASHGKLKKADLVRLESTLSSTSVRNDEVLELEKAVLSAGYEFKK